MRSIFLSFIVLFVVLMPGCQTSRVTSPEPIEQLWQQVDSFDQQNLPRSGLAVVETIHQRSLSENNTVDYIQSVVYRVRLMEATEEDALVKSIRQLEQEVDSLWMPARQMVHSILGDLYHQFYSQHRWKLLQKGDVITNSENLHEMSAMEISFRAREHYLLSLENKELLASESSEKYLPLLLNRDEKRHLRPTIYDLLVARTVERLMDDAFFVWPESRVFELDNDSLMADRSTFLQMSLPVTDNLPTTIKAIELLQEWLQYRDNEGNMEVVTDIDLMRLQLMYPLYLGAKALGKYEQALKQLRHQTQGLEIQASVLYSHANLLYRFWHFEEEDAQRQFKSEAYELAKEAAEGFPESEGGLLARALMEQITLPLLTIQSEGVVASGEVVKYMVEYRNFDRLYTYIFPLNNLPYDHLRMPDEKWILNKMGDTRPLWETVTDLPVYGDYQSHSAELMTDTVLPYGLYAVLVSDSPFNSKHLPDNKLFSYALIQVSDLAFMELAGEKGVTVAVRNRVSGAVVEGAMVDVFTAARYGDRARKDRFGPTDEKGQIVIPYITQAHGNRRVVVVNGEDTYFGGSQWWGQPDQQKVPAAHQRSFIFSDRKVYRPGQTVHFKALLLEQEGEQLTAMEGQNLSLSLRDVNGRELSSQSLKTNDYGSVSGQFILPKGGLTGSFTLQSPFGSTNIQVEAYKRPRFEVVVEPYKGLAVVGDSLSVSAKAITLTGLPLSKAKVEWRVTRYSHVWWRNNGARSKVLATGTGITDDKGVWNIDFLADGFPVSGKTGYMNYSVEVDVTDTNGEMQSGSSSIFLSHQGYQMNTSTKDEVIGTHVRSVSVNVSLSNHSGEPVSGRVSYALEKLKELTELPPQPFWEQPDTVLWQSTQPKPDLTSKLEVARVLSTGQWTVSGTADHSIALKESLVTGHYQIRTSILDVTGDTLESVAPFKVVNPSQANYQLGEGLSLINLTGQEVRPGERAEFLVGSLHNPAHVQIYGVSGPHELINETVTLKGRWHKISIPVEPHLQGDITLQVATIKNKRIETQESTVKILDPQKELNLVLSSFRDKVKPGDEEMWTLTVTDGNDRPVKAEILALMYDAALDTYGANRLSVSPHYYRSYSRRLWGWDGFYFNHQGGRWDFGSKMLQPAAYPFFFWTQEWGSGYGSHDLVRSRGGLKSAGDGELFMTMEVQEEAEASIAITRQEGSHPPPPPPPGVNNALKIVEDGSFDLPQLRTNLNETAFFLPHLFSSGEGKAEFSFTMPGSLTRWRFMALAHTKEGASANVEQMIVASRELMVVPNMPRVVREGDELWFAANILNSSDKQLGGMAQLEIRDAVTGELVTVGGELADQIWEADAGGSAAVSWKVVVPEGLKALEVTLSAFSGQISDGERHLIPVLPSRTLVTETQPLMLTQSGRHTLNTPTLKDGKMDSFENFTLTYTEHAAWEVLGALPWLMERPHESADQVFNRFYAATVAQQIFKQYPAIERVLKVWAQELEGDENALLSALEKHPELKSALLTATPWLTEAQNDTERRKRLTSLVVEGQMDNEIYSALQLLQQMQLSDGAWPWFSGMYPSEATTIQILAGFGYLNKMGVEWEEDVQQMVDQSARWLLEQLKDEKNAWEKRADKEQEAVVPARVIHKLYALSYWSDRYNGTEVDFWVNILRQQLPREPVMLQSYAALVLKRRGFDLEAAQLIQSLKEYLLTGENDTRFFKLPDGPHWSLSSIETHVAAMEAFRESGSNDGVLTGMENWVIQQKRTQQWRTTRATVSAIYALAGASRELFDVSGSDKLLVDGQAIAFGATETASGYRSFSLQGSAIDARYGAIVIDKQKDTPSFASVQLSYYQSADSVQAGGFLDVQSSLLKREMIDNREKWVPVGADTELKPGDRLMQRLVVETPQPLDFLHVDAPRAASLEPVDLLSGYRYASGLGYYLSVTDAGAGLFVDHLQRPLHAQLGSQRIVPGKSGPGSRSGQLFLCP
ncbi:MG2 domain-containing protein [Geofilum rubicundum]|uniref:MG2 domain-containing protein n=1 Tax=Geofilum rubicundum TaxID=472113 RepID=UPI0007837499|nr:MG2 domain-containing protein [Geofilum rubicundum]